MFFIIVGNEERIDQSVFIQKTGVTVVAYRFPQQCALAVIMGCFQLLNPLFVEFSRTLQPIIGFFFLLIFQIWVDGRNMSQAAYPVSETSCYLYRFGFGVYGGLCCSMQIGYDNYVRRFTFYIYGRKETRREEIMPSRF